MKVSNQKPLNEFISLKAAHAANNEGRIKPALIIFTYLYSEL
jgi:hypothetical protein